MIFLPSGLEFQLNPKASIPKAAVAQLPVQTVKNYFQLLEDTLLGSLLPPYRKTIKRKAVATSKFYLFDPGVANVLLNRMTLKIGTPEYGKSFEHLVWRELSSYLGYHRSPFDLFYWRTSQQKEEVDFILHEKGSQGPALAIEVKSKRNVVQSDLRGLEIFAEEFPRVRKLVVSNESEKRLASGVEIWPIAEFLTALWKKELL